MHDEYNGQNPALTELRERLKGGMARMRLNQTDLAKRAGLGRTTVSEALSPAKPAPSPETVAALARALQLSVEELRELRRSAAEETRDGVRSVPGRPIGKWDPHDLEVHPAGPTDTASGPGRSGARTMPGYVQREHDRVMAQVVKDAAAGRSGAVVLVGGSSTGKTRACWEAVQPLAERGWRLWHPFDPTRAQNALQDLPRVAPHTVVWLNEAQHYLGNRSAGEQIAAAVHQLLVTAECAPVLVLGTLWPEYASRYTALPAPGEEDPHSRVRELLAGRTLTVPEAFDAPALAAAAALAESGDRLLDDALSRAGTDGQVTQDLAGAPELLNCYRHATPAAAAILEAAMDARRLGVGLHLPQAFLTDAATDYLTDTDYDHLSDDWAEQVFAELAALVHGKQAPLRRTTPRTRRRPPAPSPAVHGPAPSTAGPVFRLADYLEQHGRTSRRHLCPPASFWHAAHTHLTDPDDLGNLVRAAEDRHRMQWAHSLRHRAADHGNIGAFHHLAAMQEQAGDREGAEAMARQAAADHDNTSVLLDLARMREKAGNREGAEELLRQAADHGDTNPLYHLARMREKAGDSEGAKVFAGQAADHGNSDALYLLARMREEDAGDLKGAEALLRQAADHDNTRALVDLAYMREEAGDSEAAEALLWQADDLGNTHALGCLARLRGRAGDREGAEALAWEAADLDDTGPLYDLARMREEAGDQAGAEALARQAADRGNSGILVHLARMREKAGDRESAETMARQAAADHDNTTALLDLAVIRERAGDREGAEAPLRLAADLGNSDALYRLARMRELAGDSEGAKVFAGQAADHGNSDALYWLAGMREKAGDLKGAEALVRQAADHGNDNALCSLVLLREEAGDREGAEALARQAADHGSTGALWHLVLLREEAGDREGAEALARQGANLGSPDVLSDLAWMREEAGDREGAEALARQAADHGSTHALPRLEEKPRIFTRLWPYGLDPDGTPTTSW
ncbi:helix-turn-helix domain-containing protein [Streptomyces roseus]|uniref:Tetratricopeptide TPR4 n=1 Tax=Streptomyces roseus TaxID=66430 RepID=A0A0J6XLI8_9ACTN|nr:tetratricopeptide TPR4 [Streptomyces roseus]